MDYRQPDLSVITVNYNGFHDTCEFIDSWAATVFSVSYEMIVIDNGSTANEAALLQKTYPFIQAVRSERNLGFAGGNNLGINLAKGKYLFLLNNDVCMVKDAIPLLIKRLLSSDKIYNPQIQISAESETKRSIFREKDKTKRSKKESAQHSKSRNKSFVMTSVSAL